MHWVGRHSSTHPACADAPCQPTVCPAEITLQPIHSDNKRAAENEHAKDVMLPLGELLRTCHRSTSPPTLHVICAAR